MSNIKRVTLLGSGTSTGVPEPGCFCRVCLSEDLRDKRTRTSALVETCDHKTLLIDCSPDFHRQAVLAGIDRVDAILLTHEHYDHLGGLDDLRTFAWHHPIKIFAQARVLAAIRHRLHYYFGHNRYAGSPDIELFEIVAGESFELLGLHIEPIEVMHARLPILGYRIDDFVFFTDLKSIAPSELEKARGAKLFFVNALRAVKPHPSHQTIEEAIVMAREIGAEETALIHLSHHAPLASEFEQLLPPAVRAGYDGLSYRYDGLSYRYDGQRFSVEHEPPRSLREPEPYYFQDLGRIDYEQALSIQQQLFSEAVKAKENHQTPQNHLLFCEHNPVYTLGKHGHMSNMLFSESWLEARGISLHRIERGGDITYHGPGQITGYPIFDLEQFGMGIKGFIHTMEECILDVLRANGVFGERIEGATGIWVDKGQASERKICAIGVYSSRYVTMHGFGFNIFTDLHYFQAINPCGFADRGVTSLAEEMKTPTTMTLVKQQLEEAFRRRFRRAMLEHKEDNLQQ